MLYLEGLHVYRAFVTEVEPASFSLTFSKIIWHVIYKLESYPEPELNKLKENANLAALLYRNKFRMDVESYSFQQD